MSSSSSVPTSSSQSITTSAPFFTTGPSSTSNPQANGNGGPSSLYLFTFLATLFLLLLISCGVILRSFILRRRLRRGVEDAGVILPPTLGGHRSRKDFGEKPTFYDAWVTPGGEKWESIMPISAQIRPTPPPPIQTINSEPVSATVSTSTFLPLNPIGRWRRSQRTSNTHPPSEPHSASIQGAGEKGTVQVSVLVAMPSLKPIPSSNPHGGAEASVVREMDVGVAHLPYRINPSAEVSTSRLDGEPD